ncbi:hypothetical protein [Nonomuraea sp. NPDC005650]|uniref:hypothetical protein n=1 Tax=Nonomuraea sp. NPDC005650 TaxID=3157045 RepID=UPI0033BC7755
MHAPAERIAEVEPYEDHRHVSHLRPDGAPELARAARKVLLSRGHRRAAVVVAHRAPGPRREVELPAGKSVETE